MLLTLPTYKLDSNLVLLPGIIYNVTFSRFKAAALLSRYKTKIQIPLIQNLLNEYEFDKDDNLSGESFRSIERMNKEGGSKEENEFDWLVLAVVPNLDKIQYPDEARQGEGLNRQGEGLVGRDEGRDEAGQGEDGPTEAGTSLAAAPDGPVVTLVRVISVTDDTSNIKLTLQALNRGQLKKYTMKNEGLVRLDSAGVVPAGPKPRSILGSSSPAILKSFNSHIHDLFGAIDKFIIDYRQALIKSKNSTDKNLLTLNPLANALFIQLSGSKDFNKAYQSLQKLYKSFSGDLDGRDRAGTGLDRAVELELTLVRLVDLTGAILPFPNYQKLNLLNKFDLHQRIDHINYMVDELIEVLENLFINNEFINHWFYNEASNIQRATVVANQLKSIRLVLEGMSSSKEKRLVRRPSGASGPSGPSGPSGASSGSNGAGADDELEDDDELSAITNFITKQLPHISLNPDSKRLIVKDYKRIKSSSPGNADYHVIRNYLDVVSDLPWDKYVSKFQNNKDIDVEEAKKQLDLDHYGLDHVKKRLIQYLVVLKLLGVNAENEFNKAKPPPNDPGASAGTDSEIMIENADETSKSRRNATIKNENTKKSMDQNNQSKNMMIRTKNKSPIIMLAGPPGIGKTSLAKSIATSLGRTFQRVSLGGIKDESEIRGHRRTYVGAMPGVIVQSLRKSRSMNPVILLDEIDKVVGGNNSVNKFNGDPSAALLEVLDPEQNNSFTDHYLGFPIDLSQVIFICTANEPYNLSRPLLDRLEMIELNAYDYHDKLVIGKKYLLPRQVQRNGLPDVALIDISDDIMAKVINNYTREAGVRNLERRLGTICRYKAVEYSRAMNKELEYKPLIEEFDLPKYLGIPYPSMSMEIYETPDQVGIVNGLSYNGEGSGSVLTFESIGFSNDKGGSLNMTGRLGEVLMESAKIGLTFIKLILYKNSFGFSEEEREQVIDRFKNLEIHLHVPMGSILKDGPSAGITMALLFLSLIVDKPIPKDIAMTGEITLRGMVLPIGGLKEKILGAHLSGIKRVIVPRENRKDLIEEYIKAINNDERLNELLVDNESKYQFKMKDPEQYFEEKYGIRVYFASEFWDVIKVVWDQEIRPPQMVEYHM